MATETKTQVGWVITSAEQGSRARIGYGQSIEQAGQTQESFDAIVGRTIYLGTGLKSSDIPADKQVRWRAYSDDGDFAYAGVIDIGWLFHEDDLGYNLDRFCMEDWGATVVLYNGNDILANLGDINGSHMVEYMQRKIEVGERHSFQPSGPEIWFPIYG